MSADIRYFDSHCHLQDDRFEPDRKAVLERARDAGVREIVVIGVDPSDAAAGRSLVAESGARAEWPKLWFTAGLHPHEASRWDSSVRFAVEGELDRGAVALGEVGLDFHYDNSPRDLQREAFRDQLAIARERALPVVIHSREAEDETLEMLSASGVDPDRIVLHCFTGSLRMLQRGVDNGYYVSFSGIATFGSFDSAGLLPLVPADRLLVETDAPYL
ncbi:MAG TPA: TatD family hydrolase, partial [Gemmatimonadota bacterium]|nr:TatD family hydrolase [Gemmatimonadota bacterium]